MSVITIYCTTDNNSGVNKMRKFVLYLSFMFSLSVSIQFYTYGVIFLPVSSLQVIQSQNEFVGFKSTLFLVCGTNHHSDI